MLAWLIGLVISLIIYAFARLQQNFEFNGGSISKRPSARTMQTVIIAGNEHLDRKELNATLFGGFPFSAKEPREFSQYQLTSVARVPQVDFIYMHFDNEDKEIKRYYNIVCSLKTMLNTDSHRCFTDKQCLMLNIRDFATTLIENGAFPRHYEELADARKELDNSAGKMLIVKPSGRSFYSGRGIYVVANARALSNAIEEMRKMRVRDYIISDYIWDVMTFCDPVDSKYKKFHLRSYLLVFPHSRKRERLARIGTNSPNPPPDYCEWELWDTHKILTAHNEYDAQQTTAEYTDTHASSTSENYFFPNEVARISDKPNFAQIVQEQAENIAHAVLSFAWAHLRIYPECRAAYEVFGLDFLIARNADNSPRVVLIEINDRVGMGSCEAARGGIEDPNTPSGARFIDFSARYFKWVFSRTIIPFFGAGEKIPMNIINSPCPDNIHYPQARK